MRQQTLASQASFEKFGRKGKRELFLDQMKQVVPWSELLALVEPHYPKAGNGRQPLGLAIMLRTYFLQQWFNLSDPGMEEAFYDSPALRRFAGVDLGVAAAPDETTILRFRHPLEEHELCGMMLDTVNLYLNSKGTREVYASLPLGPVPVASGSSSGSVSVVSAGSTVPRESFTTSSVGSLSTNPSGGVVFGS
jgi:IS5 family transposase